MQAEAERPTVRPETHRGRAWSRPVDRRKGRNRYSMTAMPLSEIVGHAPIIALLRQAVKRGSIPQTLLFAGPEGVGKRSTAIALAQAVNCPERRRAGGDDACGRCTTCQRIPRDQHSDVTLVDRGDDATIKLKTLRERVLDAVGYRPFEADRRIFIIEADDLREDGQDALLKTLEEPTPSVILILLSAYPDSLSPTVQSRCRRLRFGLLTEAEVTRVLTERAGVERRAAIALAAASGGSIARALSEQAGDVSEDRDAALAILAATRRGVGEQLKAAAAFAKNDSDRRDREALGTRIDMLAALLRDVGLIVAGSNAALANGDLEADLRSLAPQFTAERVAAGYGELNRAQAALESNASPKLVSDWIALHL
jgi:DNA polymerase III subunit delta'